MNIIKNAHPVKKPSTLKLISLNKTYYSSLINEKQYIYSFFNTVSTERCISFLTKYKEVNKTYPDLYPQKIRKNKNENGNLTIKSEKYDIIKKECLLNNIGIIGITYFDYTYFDIYLDKKKPLIHKE